MSKEQESSTKYLGKKERKVSWIGKKGIINVDLDVVLSKGTTPEDVEVILQEIKDLIESVPGKKRLLVKLTPYLGASMRASQFRKKLAEKIKYHFKKPLFDKAAVYGGDVISRTITSFILKGSGLKNVKVFKIKEDSQEWLKK